MDNYRSKEYPDGKGYERHGSPTFYSLLEEMADTHDKKSHDYASNENPCGNYHFAGQLACLFAHSPDDAGFVGRLAEKIYRLANLERSHKTPANESIADTERDIAVITALWMADRRDRRLALNKVQLEEFSTTSRDLRDRFLRHANNLHPYDIQAVITFLAELQRTKHGKDNTTTTGPSGS
jgi:hypothetical protein